MPIGYVLYSKKAGKRKFESSLEELKSKISVPLEYINIERIKNYRVFLSNLEADDVLIICGGGGALYRFINNISDIDINCEVLFYPCGSCNDLAHEMNYEPGADPFPITDYIKNLPIVTVNEKKYRFINGVGFGIDGYCCQVRDQLKTISDKPVNYVLIAIKGLLFYYKPTAAKVTVDGVTHTYKKVWLSPTMLGKYYGGGMMPTPDQDRSSGTLSTLVCHNAGKLKTLAIFHRIFKGKHLKYKKNIGILQGREITVEFDRPTALQIDGETILGVTSYTACSAI